MKIDKTQGFTIFSINKDDKFRIVQESEKEFVVKKLFARTVINGYFWWVKSTFNEWRTIDCNGDRYYELGMSRQITNEHLFKKYNTLDKAIKWIKDYEKYPINH